MVSNTPTNLAGTIGLVILAVISFIGMLTFFFVGMVFQEAYVPAIVCLGILGLSCYRLFGSR